MGEETKAYSYEGYALRGWLNGQRIRARRRTPEKFTSLGQGSNHRPQGQRYAWEWYAGLTWIDLRQTGVENLDLIRGELICIDLDRTSGTSIGQDRVQSVEYAAHEKAVATTLRVR